MMREQIAEVQDRHDESVVELQRTDEVIREVVADGVADPAVADRVFEVVVGLSRVQDGLRSIQGRLARLSAQVDAEEGGDDA
jgi:hypothetical protein